MSGALSPAPALDLSQRLLHPLDPCSGSTLRGRTCPLGPAPAPIERRPWIPKGHPQCLLSLAVSKRRFGRFRFRFQIGRFQNDSNRLFHWGEARFQNEGFGRVRNAVLAVSVSVLNTVLETNHFWPFWKFCDRFGVHPLRRSPLVTAVSEIIAGCPF